MNAKGMGEIRGEVPVARWVKCEISCEVHTDWSATGNEPRISLTCQT